MATFIKYMDCITSFSIYDLIIFLLSSQNRHSVFKLLPNKLKLIGQKLKIYV